MKNIGEILAIYTSGENTLEQTNAELKTTGARYTTPVWRSIPPSDHKTLHTQEVRPCWKN